MRSAPIVSMCSGICRASRSAREAVTTTAVDSPATSSVSGTSTSLAGASITTVRVVSENPGRSADTRYSPAAGTLTS